MIGALQRHATEHPQAPALPAAKVFELAGLKRSQRRTDELARLAADEGFDVTLRVDPQGRNGGSVSLYRYDAEADDAAALGF